MSYINRIRKMTKDSFPLRIKAEIDKVKTGIENVASNGEYEYRRTKSSFTYLNEIMEYFKKEGFQVKIEEIIFEDPYMTLRDDYLTINWKEQNNDGDGK